MVKKEEKQLVESVLFSASKPVSIAQIKKATNLSPKKIKEAIEELTEEYNIKRKDETSMEITKAGDKYTMQIKEKYLDKTIRVTDPEIDDNLLKTLSLIAFHQPLKQSNLRRMIGTKAYEHVDKLVSIKLVNTKKYRNTEMLTTTKYFPEYFGIDTTNPEEIKNYLIKKIVTNIQKNNS